jgi:ribosomal-protein-serine acetyltransferase
MFNLAIDKDISLRTLLPEDAGELFNLIERNRERLRPWIDPYTLPETLKGTLNHIARCLHQEEGDSAEAWKLYGDYFITMTGYFPGHTPQRTMGLWVNGKLSGELMFSRLEDSFTAAEFGYWITAEQEGKGIITRCISALMDYGVDIMEIQRFVICCAVNNQRSRSVAERLGYRLHATQPNREVVGELVYDRAVYGIRSKTWLEQRKAAAPGA